MRRNLAVLLIRNASFRTRLALIVSAFLVSALSVTPATADIIQTYDLQNITLGPWPVHRRPSGQLQFIITGTISGSLTVDYAASGPATIVGYNITVNDNAFGSANITPSPTGWTYYGAASSSGGFDVLERYSYPVTSSLPPTGGFATLFLQVPYSFLAGPATTTVPLTDGPGGGVFWQRRTIWWI